MKKIRCKNCKYLVETEDGKVYCTEFGQRYLNVDYLMDPYKPKKLFCFRKKKVKK